MSEIYKKLSSIQEELKAPKDQFNSFGKYNYRSCEDIVEASKPVCKKHGTVLLVSDMVKEVGGRVYVQALATLTCIEDNSMVSVTGWAREAETRKGMDDSQITGATSSYARKYALNGLFAIDDTKDADTMKPQATDEKPQAKQAQSETINNDSNLEVFYIAIDALTSKESGHKWKRDNEEAINSLGADKGKVMTKYLNKIKELK
jgi:hypothetical protein